ncbi:MAG: AGE family epimerase/isomerase, partial [Bacteroidales bacterium]|nr:AGE family epimerase/isomerase [Bacteroidales bacterium]
MNHSQKTPAEIFASKALASQMRRELTGNILPYWMEKMTNPSGGFHGRIDGREHLDTQAPVGGIMTARVLWTFASAYRVLSASATTPAADLEGYLQMAMRAKRLLLDSFIDPEFGGTYWSLTADFKPLDTKKQIYAIAFTIYGLAELYRACGDLEALEAAINLFNSIEEHSYDPAEGGYFEAFTRSWEPIEDMRLSDKDANESKTMNTHLHFLEAYTCLYRVWKDSLLEERLRSLIEVFEKHILDENGHLKLFFDNSWKCGYDIVSYGHDIEASWLLHEAALVLGDKAVLDRIENLVPSIVEAAAEGFTPSDGLIYEKSSEEVDKDRHWWVQAEAVVGFFNLWDHFGAQSGLENALASWEFIKSSLIDHENGEWFWSVRADGTVNRDDDKAGFWKCPYHNGRMCMEI